MALFRGRDRAGGVGSIESNATGANEHRNTPLPARETRAETSQPSDRSQKSQAEAKNRGGDGVANIGKSISIKGDLSGNEDLVVEGKVEGKIDLPSNQLTIGANGTARAEITAKSVVIVGRVTGNVTACLPVATSVAGKVTQAPGQAYPPPMNGEVSMHAASSLFTRNL